MWIYKEETSSVCPSSASEAAAQRAKCIDKEENDPVMSHSDVVMSHCLAALPSHIFIISCESDSYFLLLSPSIQYCSVCISVSREIVR